MFRSVSVLLCVVALTNATSLFTDQEKNAEILKEVALSNYSLIGDRFGFSSGNPLGITAGAFSSAGWSFNLTGMYLGMPIVLGFSGSFDQASDAGSFASAGTVGSTSVSGTGTWMWTDVSGMEEDLGFSTSLVFASRAQEWDLEEVPGRPKKYIEFPRSNKDMFVDDSGILQVTFQGLPTGELVRQSSFEVVPKEFVRPTEVDGAATLGSSYLAAAAFYPSGTVTGSISTIPEPATLATGLAGVFLCALRRKRRKARSIA